jgi:uncharacterized protein (DUF2267 family)
MSATGLEVFDTVQKTNRWLNDAMGLLDTGDKHKAYLAFRSTLHALRDRMTVEQVAHYEDWHPTGKPLKLRTREEFLDRVAQELGGAGDGLDPEPLARAVFVVLDQRLSEGEIEDLKASLPEKIREVWPS